MDDKRHVALIVETSSVYGRDLLAGIVRFMGLHNNWSVFLEQRDLWKQPPSWLKDWHGDGIITRVTTAKLLSAVAKTKVPLVEVTDRHGTSDLPQVRSDDRKIGQLAAEHLIERGFSRFAFCGFAYEAWSQRRQVAFCEAVAETGDCECAVYNSPWHGPRANTWEDEQTAIIRWLQSLSPPVAVMACNDIRGQHVLDACSKLSLAVPEQVAVIGVDNDELLCRICSPPLSSVIPSAEVVGYRAAEILHRLMNGEEVDHAPVIAEPMGIAMRQSTDVVAIDDRNVASALHYIRRHACRGLSIAEVVRNNPISRSTLERQLRRYLGRSPQEEIRHVQIRQVRELLRTTDLPAERIAPLCGFQHSEYMHVVFKRLTGMTTGQFRQKIKPTPRD